MTVRGLLHFSPLYARSVHTMSEEYEKAAFFLRLGPSSILIRHENGTFRKRFSNWKNMKTPALRFDVEVKHFEKTMTSR